MLLMFKDDELQENCPCPLETQHLLKDFHHQLKTHCGGNSADCIYLNFFVFIEPEK